MKDTRNEKMLKLEQNYEIITNPEFLVNTREYGRCRCLNRQDLKDCTCHLLMCQELKKMVMMQYHYVFFGVKTMRRITKIANHVI